MRNQPICKTRDRGFLGCSLIMRLTRFKSSSVWNTIDPDDQPWSILETSKTEREFGFSAEIGFEERLKETVEWYKKTRSRP